MQFKRFVINRGECYRDREPARLKRKIYIMIRQIRIPVTVSLLVLLIFLQPHVQCNNRKKAATVNNLPRNPLYTPDSSAGIQWAMSAPDEVLAADVKLQPTA